MQLSSIMRRASFQSNDTTEALDIPEQERRLEREGALRRKRAAR